MIKKVSIIILVFLMACSENPTNTIGNDTPVIETLKMAKYWNIVNVNQQYPIEIRTYDKQGYQDIRSIELTVENDGNIVFADSLFDDGGINGSTDVLAGDGVFKNVFRTNQIGSTEGDYIFKFIASDLKFNVDSISFSAMFILNSIPEIRTISIPDSFLSGFGSLNISISISDLDEDFENDSLFMDVLINDQSILLKPYSLANDGSIENGDLVANDSIYSLKLDSSFAVGKNGEYNVQFFATDQIGNETERINRSLFIQNNAPYITNINMPDVVNKPAFIPIKITVNDPQSIQDISRVYFELKASDGSYVESSPGIHLQEDLYDDGDIDAHGDDLRGDGIYSVILEVLESNTSDTYTFEFYGIDKVGNMSALEQYDLRIKDISEE